jgi:hypothetical protein
MREMPGAKKNQLIDKARSLVASKVVTIRFEQTLKEGFVREGVTSSLTYERRYRKGKYPEYVCSQIDLPTSAQLSTQI